MTYAPSKSIDSVFNRVQDFQDICSPLQNRKTDMKLVTYAYLVFQKAGIFMTSLLDWNKKAIGERTFENLKVFMRKEYREL